MPAGKPLSDDEVCDLLHRLAFELEQRSAETTRGQTALTAARAALLTYLQAMIWAMGSAPSLRPPPD